MPLAHDGEGSLRRRRVQLGPVHRIAVLRRGAGIGLRQQGQGVPNARCAFRQLSVDHRLMVFKRCLAGMVKTITVQIRAIGRIVLGDPIHVHRAVDLVCGDAGRDPGLRGAVIGRLGHRLAQGRDNSVRARDNFVMAGVIEDRRRRIQKLAFKRFDAQLLEDVFHIKQHFAGRVREHFTRRVDLTHGVGVAGGDHMRFRDGQGRAINHRISGCVFHNNPAFTFAGQSRRRRSSALFRRRSGVSVRRRLSGWSLGAAIGSRLASGDEAAAQHKAQAHGGDAFELLFHGNPCSPRNWKDKVETANRSQEVNMHLTIGSILSAETLAEARALMDQVRWDDGAKTAGPTARQVKRNRQADLSSKAGAKLRGLLENALATHTVFNAATRPKRFSKLIVSETSDGGEYGAHVDNPFMGRGEDRIRTDVSFTLFLSDPEHYEGGELVIDQAGATQSVKGQAGDVFLYPSTSLHAVTPVTSGARRVCVGWIESDIPDAGDRELLYDLENLHASLSRQYTPHSAEMLMVTKIYANLTRRLSR